MDHQAIQGTLLIILILGILIPSIGVAYPTDDTNTIFLMHFNNSYISEGGQLTKHINTVFNNAIVKFGSNSLNLTSDGANVSVSTTGLSISPCTIDFWMYSTDWTSQPITMIGDGVANGYIQYYSSKLNYDHAANLLNFGNPSLNTWHHYALVDNGTYLIAYLDGNLISTHLTVGFKLIDGGSEFHIGTIPVYHLYYLRGYIDEFRISNVDRYNSLPFTPPTNEYLPLVLHPPIANFTVSSYQQHKDDLINMTDDSSCYQCTERLWNITREIPVSPVYHVNISDLDISKYWPDWGVYNITKQVRNASGMNETYKHVTIWNITPDSDFSGVPLTGTKPLDVTFTDASIGNITHWNWSFGDGNISSLTNPTNLYSQSGVFDVSLSVSNADESNNNLQISYITITDPTPPTTTTTTAPPTTTVRFINIDNSEKEWTIEEIMGSVWAFLTGEIDLSGPQGPQGAQGAQGIPGVECLNCSGSALAYDLENISHPLGTVPRVVLITGSNSSQIISVVNRTNQTFQVSIRDFNDTPGANETIDWMVKL